MVQPIFCRAFFAVVTISAGFSSAMADEGMWLFNNPPLKQLKEKYQFEPTPQWLEHLQKSSVRFNSGGSGSFVSADGLVITNHHVGLDTLQKIGSEKNNYVRDGFYAKTQKDEVKATDLELNVLISIEDVTERVNAGVPSGLSGDDASKARKKVIAEIEKESKEKTGLRSDVTTLYQGGVYNLYRYKRYDDVRIVFAPDHGSPVVNKANEFVGIIFDGNIQSLALDIAYSDKQARAVSVDSAAITEALRKVYDAGALADELGK